MALFKNLLSRAFGFDTIFHPKTHVLGSRKIVVLMKTFL